jgi:hypothetical protein
MDAESNSAPPARIIPTDAIHFVRTVYSAQYQLSQMADQKASLLMGATFVIFSITVGQLKASGTAPTALLILGAAAFVSALLAVMAVLPSTKVPPKADGPGNLLFFGAFTQISEEEFVARMLAMLPNLEEAYAAFAHDIYQNGSVLGRKKYRLLGYAYRVMLTGLIASFLALVLHLAAGIG